MRQRCGTQLDLFGAPPVQTDLPEQERRKAIELLKALLTEAVSTGGKSGGARREVSDDKDHG